MKCDERGNIYVTGFARSANFPLKYNLAPCGSFSLVVFDSSGGLLQSTYIPGVAEFGPLSAVLPGPDATLYVAGPLDSGYYVNFLFSAEPQALVKIQAKLTLNEDVYRQRIHRLPAKKAASKREKAAATA